MRAVWRGSVSFGLVVFPVRLVGATRDHGFRFHEVHRADGGRLRHRRVCSVCDAEVDPEGVCKGYELPDGRLVLLEAEDFEGLAGPVEPTMEVVQFAAADEVDPILFGRSYFVEPERVAVPSYAVLRDVLTRSSRVAVVRMGLRRREVLGVLRPRGGVLVLHTLLWPDEVREPDFDSVDVGVGAAEVRLAESLVDSMTAPFDPSVFSDGYREALGALIEARAAGDGIPVSRAPGETGGEAHLLDALRRSLERVRSGRIRREE
ncbi:Ku protein [Saccharothrix sp. ALI-22-I]|uniref:non-homologous end joining protein Ku n=1 Tax=Saccharothrix sp. ALI-22-I TaxID=1933778 RepID=UPI00097BD951|nr:Ku protein [Saccharothrix sp. ALI-22-I]ONI86661.1 Ku protein [Saccharothrix sp. ALI-22-I]